MPKLTPLHYRVLVRIFEAEGFSHRRTSGDHMIYTKEGIVRPLVIPRYKQIPVFVIKALLRTAQIDRERFLEILGQR